MKTYFKSLTGRQCCCLLLLLFTVSTRANAQSLLWRITGNNLSSPSFLYGTIHISDARVFELRDSVFKQLDQCDAFAGEIDLSMESMMKIAGMILLPGNETLRDRFDAEEYAMIKDAVYKCSGMDLSLFDKVKPAALIGLCFNDHNTGDLEATVDELLYKRAKEKNLHLNALETIEEQVALMDKIPDTYVVEYFRNADSHEEEFEKLVRNYRNANLDSLWILLQDEESGSMLNEELIRQRNFRMAERILPMIKSGSSFIAVGCGHLPGTDGIIELLRRKGYIVEPEVIR